MAMTERLKKSTSNDYSRPIFTGKFATLQEFLLEKESFFWSVLRLFEFLLRGFGQVVFANNPLSGLLIVISLGVSVPNTLIFSTITGFLGLLLSMLIRESQEDIINGVTVFNPLLVGAISSQLIPKFYGPFDAFSILLTILGTIFSVYLTRSLRNIMSLFIAWPFHLVEFALFFVFYTQDNGLDAMEKLQPIISMNNATSDAATSDVSFIGGNITRDHIDWGMVKFASALLFTIRSRATELKMFQGVVMSASQVFAVESVATGAIIYLAVLLSSPTMAGFAFFGALIGSLAGITLGVPIDEIYSGFWGYNSLLTACSFEGTHFLLNGQIVAATVVAIVYTVIVQYSILFFFRKLKFPIIALPFVLVASFFLRLRSNAEDKTFPQPLPISLSKEQHEDYLARQRMLIQQVNDPEETKENVEDGKNASELNV